MTLFLLSAAACDSGQDFVVSVMAADGLPRRGLQAENFAVAQFTEDAGDTPTDRSVVRVAEGPQGFYRLALVPDDRWSGRRPSRSVLAITVSAPPHGGGANYHGQTLTVLERSKTSG